MTVTLIAETRNEPTKKQGYAPGTPEYQQLVEEGRACIRQDREARFKLGDLALKIAPNLPGSHGKNRGLAQFAEDIGVSYDYLRNYRRVSFAWPPSRRTVDAAWTTYRELALAPNRFGVIKDGMSADEALIEIDHKPSREKKRSHKAMKPFPHCPTCSCPADQEPQQ